ncbi:polysaccharide deacetylase family protein [Bacillus stercoris]|uniref:polysaccharide deacetylase family protein n=1 Tax=Bacillus stercoris TaxID=2054641 RepID=UPI002ACA20F0|nr:polysaccharide deacetylase family protein [Bacillus stercoris]MDZ5670447.1 polysaccharide deacetylase family protein [Bacillus stercoris]
MLNSPKSKHKLRIERLLGVGFCVFLILCITLVSLSWNAIAGPKLDSLKERKASSGEIHKEKNKNTAEKKEVQKTSPQIGKVVYLTFDDGPNPAASEKIIDLLDKYNAKGTFFMLKPNIERNTDIVRKMVKNGHSVGSHGVTHQVSEIYKSPESFEKEMNDTLKFIKETTETKSHLIRAPYGSKPYITRPFREVVKRDRFNLWDWTVDSEDWKYTHGEMVKNTIQQVNNLVGKEPLVVLMHEKPTTAAYLEELLKYFKDNGYEMKKINDSIKPVQFRFN